MGKKGLLIILSGPSGVGKGTIRQEIMKEPDLGLCYSVSLTTRAPREGEKDGIDYFFVSEEEFERQVGAGNLLEYTRFVKHSYGTPRDYVERLRSEGKNVLLEIEVNGAMQVMRKMKDDPPLSIFILPPSYKELERRIRGRSTECEAVIQERLKQAKDELRLAENYSYRVINDNVGGCVSRIAQIIRQEMGS